MNFWHAKDGRSAQAQNETCMLECAYERGAVWGPEVGRDPNGRSCDTLIEALEEAGVVVKEDMHSIRCHKLRCASSSTAIATCQQHYVLRICKFLRIAGT